MSDQELSVPVAAFLAVEGRFELAERFRAPPEGLPGLSRDGSALGDTPTARSSPIFPFG
jgi:hypothetical protein